MQDPAIATPSSTAFKHDNLQAIGWLLVSIVGSSIMTLGVRELSFTLDPRMIVLLRYIFTVALLVVAIGAISSLRKQLSFKRPGVHLLRGTCMGMATHLGFYAIAHIDLVTVTVLFFTVPIFATMIAGVVNGERTGPRRIAAIAVSFVGVLLILKPGYAPIEWAILAALFSSVIFAFALTLSRRVAQADGTFSALVSSSVITLVMSIPLAIPVLEMPQTSMLWWVVAIVVLSGIIRLVADIQAYRIGEASVLAPISYLRLITIGVAAYFLYGEVPDATSLAGAAIIIAAALYITRREAFLKKRSSIEAK